MTTETMTTFEAVTCGRCGGSGNYSFNMMWGTVCFKCHGAGRIYTKRGGMAKDHYTRLLSKPASELRPGMKVLEYAGLSSKKVWMTVERIGDNSVEKTSGHYVNNVLVHTGLNIQLSGVTLGGWPETTMFRVAATADEKKAAMTAALAFQATLTKQGKPRK